MKINKVKLDIVDGELQINGESLAPGELLALSKLVSEAMHRSMLTDSILNRSLAIQLAGNRHPLRTWLMAMPRQVAMQMQHALRMLQDDARGAFHRRVIPRR